MTPQTIQRIFVVIYEHLELKINLKVGLLTPKTMPKQVLNNSKTASNKVTFSTPKIGKRRMPTWQKRSIFGSIFDQRAVFLACWH